MNARLSHTLDFSSLIYLESQFPINHYSITLDMMTQSDDRREMNIAWERLKFMVQNEFNGTVFINQKEREKSLLLHKTGLNVTTVPDDPVDQIIGIMLLCKLNAVMEGRILVTELSLCSQLGDRMWYSQSIEDSVGPFAENGWWHLGSILHNDLSKLEKTKITRLQKEGWKDLDLDWKPVEDSADQNKVVYADFTKNETK